MNKIMLVVCLLFVSAVNAAYAGQSLVSKLYSIFLGNQEVKAEYKELTQQALKDLGVKHYEDVSIKQMNAIGPTFARFELSSFTAFGIWLDERYLDTCTQEEKLFHIYHEAAHYALRHHKKIVAGGVVALPLTILGLMKLGTLQPEGSWGKYGLVAGGALVAALATYFFVLPQIVKRQEKQADIKAAQALIKIGKEHVVQDHLQVLKLYRDQDNADAWWYSPAQQSEYLKKLTS